MSIEEIQQKRDKLRKEHEDAKAVQYELDLEQLLELEMLHGFERVHPVHLDAAWRMGVGAATMVVCKLPTSGEQTFRRFQEMGAKKDISGRETREAMELLAASCVVYPERDSDEYKATIDIAPGILAQAAVMITKAVQGKAAEEGK